MAQREGKEERRQGIILRITSASLSTGLDEALEQGGVLTQEDLARALGVHERTIRRDVQVLKAEGHLVHTRGRLKGVGRGQTHKVKILRLWLDRESYERIALWMHHSPQAIKRYVSTFLRMAILHRQGASVEENAFLTKSSVRLVKDYLVVYEEAMKHPQRREKLEEEIARVSRWQKSVRSAEKKGGIVS